MKILALVIVAYTLLMLVIHVSSGKILKAWSEDSWLSRRFTPQRVLRVEVCYWALTLVAWTRWPSAAWKALVVAFAAIHLGLWLAGEAGAATIDHSDVSGLVYPRKIQLAIIAFDLIEAAMLVAIGWFSVLFVVHRG